MCSTKRRTTNLEDAQRRGIAPHPPLGLILHFDAIGDREEGVGGGGHRCKHHDFTIRATGDP